MEAHWPADEPYPYGLDPPDDENAQTCSLEQGNANYARAQAVLEQLNLRLAKCRPPPMKLPTLIDICNNVDTTSKALHVPHHYQTVFLLSNINTIAGELQWSVQPDRNANHLSQNAALWFYNSDTGHSFSHRMNNIRYNVLVMAFLWALNLTGECEDNLPWSGFINPSDARGEARKEFWTTYISAWLEALKPNGWFHAQERFLEVWAASEFDLVLFTRRNTQRMQDVIEKLKEKMPKVPYINPLDFLHMTQHPDGFSLTELRQYGPAYALHFVLASIEDARRLDKVMEEYEMMKIREYQQQRFDDDQVIAEQERMVEDSMDVDKKDEDKNEDKPEEPPLPDVTRLKWDEPPLAYLLSVDASTNIGVSFGNSQLPRSITRCEWIDQAEAIEMLWSKVDDLGDILNGLAL